MTCNECFVPRAIFVVSNQGPNSSYLTYTDWVDAVNAALASDPDLRIFQVYSGSKGQYDVAVLVK